MNPPRVYGRAFWLTYGANILTMVAVSCLFRYADFVQFFGGSELQLGLIVGVGMIGALVMRSVQGVGLDRLGPRWVWLVSLAMFIIAVLLHCRIDNVHGWPVYAVRILMMIGLSGAFGASLTFISQTAPPGRMGEMLGMLGTSGFLGLAIGPSLSDSLLPDVPAQADIQRMFLAAAAVSCGSFVLAALATRGSKRPVAVSRPPSLLALRQYHPGSLMLVAAAMGFGLNMPGVFVRSYASELNLGGIGPFFLVYAGSAFGLRVLTRRLSDEIGVRPVVLAGLTLLSISMLTYLAVSNQAMLCLTAVVAGAAHALLFPAVLAGGNAAFPPEFRGLATTLSLAMFDLGNLVGQPLVGLLLQGSRQMGWAAYPTTFSCLAAILLVVVAIYYAVPSRQPLAESVSKQADQAPCAA